MSLGDLNLGDRIWEVVDGLSFTCCCHGSESSYEKDRMFSNTNECHCGSFVCCSASDHSDMRDCISCVVSTRIVVMLGFYWVWHSTQLSFVFDIILQIHEFFHSLVFDSCSLQD